SLTDPNDNLIGYSVSSDAGASFQDQGNPPSTPHGTGTDPVLARSLATGTVFLSTNQSDPASPAFNYLGVGVNVYRSTNNGPTFQQPVSVAPGLVHGVDHEDKPWIAVDNSPGPATAMSTSSGGTSPALSPTTASSLPARPTTG